MRCGNRLTLPPLQAEPKTGDRGFRAMPEDRNADGRADAGRPRKRGGMDFLDVRTPFFDPLWRRVLATGMCLAWTLYELSTGSVFWAILFGAASAHLFWQFFVVFDRKPDGDGDAS